MLHVGEAVSRYRTLYRLGAGGMAEVWAVEHGDLGTRHALKVLRGASPTSRERLLREGRLQARLDPTHVVPVTDVVDVAGAPGLVMPLVEGCSLAQLLDEHRPSEGEALALLAGIAAGVAAVHAEGVAHRDLKPANILLHLHGGRVVPRVADFGIARELDTAGGTLAGAFLGTPAYAAPEQLSDATRADTRADLWALGVILYELLVGRRPFEADGVEALLYAVHRDPVPLEPVPERWRALVSGLLTVDPAERFGPAEALVAALPAADGPAMGSAVAEVVRRHAEAGRASCGGSTSRPSGAHALPSERDAFFGRDRELEALRELLSASRLVSVLGVGGAGKTRLVTRFGWQQLADWPGGVWFCSLAEARSADGVLAAVGRALDVPLDRGDPVRRLAHALQGRGRCLVVLDNAEQVAAEVAELVGAWLDDVSEAAFLVTTRRRLKVGAERSLTLDPLPPQDAAALFVERAATARPGFEPSADDREAIAALVAMLDGLPLAIELAAARARVLSPSRILERMEDRFRVLASRRLQDARHATLRATLDDSWDLLSESARAALARMSVFEGGFDLAAAEAVLGPGDAHAVELIEVLVDHSLVRVLGPNRFGLLASVQEYAVSKLEDAGDVHQRHAAVYARLGAEDALEALRRHGGAELRRTLALELDNLVAATRRAADRRVAACCALAAWEVLELQGPYEVGVALLEAVQDVEDPPLRVRVGVALATAHLAAGQHEAALAVVRETSGFARDPRSEAALAHVLGQQAHLTGRRDEARAHYERALAGWDGASDGRARGIVERNLGALAAEAGDVVTAEAHYERALALMRQAGDTVGEAHVLGNRANLYGQQGQLDRALQGIEQALALQREAGNRSSEGILLLNLGNVRMFQGDQAAAREMYRASLAIHRETGSPESAGIALAGVGLTHANEAAYDDALRCFEAALALHRQVEDRSTEARTLSSIADVVKARGDLDEALRRYEEALALHEDVQDWPSVASILNNIANLHVDRGALEEADACYERGIATSRRVNNRRLVGMSTGNLARLRHAQGRLAEAIALTEEALGVLREVGDRRNQASCLAQLGRMQLEAGRAEVARTHLDEALALADEVGNAPIHATVWASRGALERLAGDLQAAGEALDRARALDPHDAGLLCELALLRLEHGDLEAAQRGLDEARTRAGAVSPRSPLGQRLQRTQEALTR